VTGLFDGLRKWLGNSHTPFCDSCTMNKKGTTRTSRTPAPIGAGGAPEQLTLLGSPAVPLQFRLDERTRRSGLEHVAQLRAQIAAQAAGRRGESNHGQPSVNRRAA